MAVSLAAKRPGSYQGPGKDKPLPERRVCVSAFFRPGRPTDLEHLLCAKYLSLSSHSNLKRFWQKCNRGWSKAIVLRVVSNNSYHWNPRPILIIINVIVVFIPLPPHSWYYDYYRCSKCLFECLLCDKNQLSILYRLFSLIPQQGPD